MRPLLATALAIALMMVPGLLLGTTIYVDDDAPGDPGPGDPTVSDPLEDGSAAHPFDAIQEGVDAAAWGETVLVRDGTYTGEGNRDIRVPREAITVRSKHGPEHTIVDCQGTVDDQHRGFSFHGSPKDGVDSVLDGFTVRNGCHIGAGGLLAQSSNPVIKNCIITENTAVDYTWGGGGFYSWYGAPTIIGCTITNNVSAGHGGGIRSQGITVSDCTISGNTAFDQGGGIHAWGDSINISDSVIEANSARRRGGGIYAVIGPVIMSRCIIAGNVASTREGGGIYLGAQNSLLEDCTIIGNHATESSGGGAYCPYGQSVEFERCIIEGNSAYVRGGGICSTLGFDLLSISDCIVTGNRVTITGGNGYTGGGGICCYSTDFFQARRSTITGNSAERAAGIMCDTADIESCVIANNSAVSVGAIYCRYELTLTNCTVAHNLAETAEIGIPAGTFTNCIFWGNRPLGALADGVVAGYCCVENGFEVPWFDPATCIDADPLFRDAPDGDYRLQRWSPCIDAGTSDGAPERDIVGARRWDVRWIPNTGGGEMPWYDIGAYEFWPGRRWGHFHRRWPRWPWPWRDNGPAPKER